MNGYLSNNDDDGGDDDGPVNFGADGPEDLYYINVHRKIYCGKGLF